jgi:hypothetical protein
MFVIAPRLLLALTSAVTAWQRARRIEVPLAEPYFQRLLSEARRGRARLLAVPHGAPLSAQAALGLRTLLAAAYGEDFELRIAQPVAYGDEDAPAASGSDFEPTQRFAVVDLAATPEPEAQGRFMAALCASPVPLVLLADEGPFARRFAAMPQRVQERRAAWQRFADEHRLGLACVDLEAPDLGQAVPALEAALAVML